MKNNEKHGERNGSMAAAKTKDGSNSGKGMATSIKAAVE